MSAPTASPVEPAAMGRRVAVLVAAYGAVVLWGATPLATKVAVAELDPLAVGLLRTLLAGAVALPLIVFGRVAPPRSGRGRADLVVAGCAILEAIMRAWPVGRVRVADRGVREGILRALVREADREAATGQPDASAAS